MASERTGINILSQSPKDAFQKQVLTAILCKCGHAAPILGRHLGTYHIASLKPESTSQLHCPPLVLGGPQQGQARIGWAEQLDRCLYLDDSRPALLNYCYKVIIQPFIILNGIPYRSRTN